MTTEPKWSTTPPTSEGWYRMRVNNPMIGSPCAMEIVLIEEEGEDRRLVVWEIGEEDPIALELLCEARSCREWYPVPIGEED